MDPNAGLEALGNVPTTPGLTPEQLAELTGDVGKGGIFALILPYLAAVTVVGLALYIYYALALMTIAKKTNTPNAWFAWIPILNLVLMAQIAQVSPWTVLIMFAGFIPVVGPIAVLAVSIWWWWKIAERRSYPGWFAILMLVPIVNLVIPGLLAWSDKSPVAAEPAKPATS